MLPFPEGSHVNRNRTEVCQTWDTFNTTVSSVICEDDSTYRQNGEKISVLCYRKVALLARYKQFLLNISMI